MRRPIAKSRCASSPSTLSSTPGRTAASHAFWYARRRPSGRELDPGTEVYLSLVDPDFEPAFPAVEALTVHATCMNRDLPAKLPFGGEAGRDKGRFHLEGRAPLSIIRCLKKPTETVRSHLQRRTQWRLISHLSLNYLSLADDPAPLKEILKLYNFPGSPWAEQHIAGITRVATRRAVRRAGADGWNGFCRGLEVSLESRGGQVHRQQRLPVRLRAGIIFRDVRIDQLFHPARRDHGAAGATSEAMATSGGRTDPPVKALLFEEGYRFRFFQAVRLLGRVYPGRQPVGRDASPTDEAVRFRSRATLEFPASDIQEISPPQDGSPAQMLVNFMGLTGPSGALPQHYTELVLERMRVKDHALRDFLDLFNHRMLSLFYRAWEKYRFLLPYERAAAKGHGTDPATMAMRQAMIFRCTCCR